MQNAFPLLDYSTRLVTISATRALLVLEVAILEGNRYLKNSCSTCPKYLDAFATIITQFLQIVSLSYHSRVKIEEIKIGEDT